MLSRFVKTYNNIPLAERDLACCVINDEAVSWKLAYFEIREKTELGERIQKKLEEMDLI